MADDLDNNNESGNEFVTLDRSSSAKVTRHPMDAFLRGGILSVARPGDMVTGKVLEKDGPKVFVDLGMGGVGIIYGREYNIARDMLKSLNPGDDISAKVVETENDEGYMELSLKDAGKEQQWLSLRKMMQEGTALELPILEANRGGLIMEAEKVKGFLPASQLSSKNYPRVAGGDKERIFQELQKLIGQTIRVKILDVDPEQEKLIFTEKELDEDALRAILAKYKVGDEVEGEITGVVDFGAFMKFYPVRSQTSETSVVPPQAERTSSGVGEESGLEGLIHISEIDWALIDDPREVLKPGDKVKAKIIDMQGNKVSLSLKALKEDPWAKVAEKYNKGDIVKGKVTKFNPFGAFVELGDSNIQGLAHISEFGTEARMREELLLDKEYDFKILLVDPKEHRMSLGMMRSEPADPAPFVVS